MPKLTIEGTTEALERFGKCERFCAGYTLPDDTTLSDVLGALGKFEEFDPPAIFVTEGSEPTPEQQHALVLRARIRDARALLAKFKKED